MTLVEKQQDWEKRKKYAELKGEAFEEAYPEAEEPIQKNNPLEVKPDVIVAADELNDDVVIAFLNKKGIKTASLDDLLPQPSAEEIAQAKEKRTSDMLAFGLSTGRFKKEEYDAFQQESANKLGLVMTEIETTLAEKIRTANPDLTPDQVAEQVAQYTFSHLPEDSILRKEREQELLQMADGKLATKYKSILSLEKDYSDYEQGQTNKTNLENKVKAALPVYQNDLKTILSGFSTINVPVDDVENPANSATIPITFTPENLQEIEDLYLQPEVIVKKIKDGYTIDDLKEEAETMLIKKHWKRIAIQSAKGYNSVQKDKYLKARKGLHGHDRDIDISDDNLETNPNKQFYEDLKTTAEKEGLIPKTTAPAS